MIIIENMLFNNNKAMQTFYQKRRTSRRIAVDIERILSCSLWSYREMGLLLLDPQALPLFNSHVLPLDLCRYIAIANLLARCAEGQQIVAPSLGRRISSDKQIGFR